MGMLPTRYSPVCRWEHGTLPLPARLACVRHAASVNSEPGSNSPYKSVSGLSAFANDYAGYGVFSSALITLLQCPGLPEPHLGIDSSIAVFICIVHHRLSAALPLLQLRVPIHTSVC